MSRYLSSLLDSRTVSKLSSFVSIAREVSTTASWSYVDMTVGLSFYLLNERDDDDDGGDDESILMDGEKTPSNDDQGTAAGWISQLQDVSSSSSAAAAAAAADGDGDGDGDTGAAAASSSGDDGGEDPDVGFILQSLELWCHFASITTLMNRYTLQKFIHKCHTVLQFFPVVVKYEIAATTERNGYCLCIDHTTRSVLLLINGTQTIHDLLTDMTASASLFMDGHFAHKGFQQSARWFYHNLRHVIREKLQQYNGYSLRIVGHSAGAGTASLLTLLLDNDEKFANYSMHCLAFACPKVLSLDLASQERTKDLITSFVLNDDLVPRFSVEAFREFRPKLGDWETQFWASDFGSKLNAVHSKVKSAGVIYAFNRAYSWYTSKSTASSSKDSGSDGENDDDDLLSFPEEGDFEMESLTVSSLNSSTREVISGSMEVPNVEVKRPVVRPPPTEFNVGIELYPAGRIVYLRAHERPVAQPEGESPQSQSTTPEHELESAASVDQETTSSDGSDESPTSSNSDTPAESSKETKKFETVARVRLAQQSEFEKLEKLSKKTLVDHFSSAYSKALNALMMQLLGKKPAYLVNRTLGQRRTTLHPPPPPSLLVQQKKAASASSSPSQSPANDLPPVPHVRIKRASSNVEPLQTPKGSSATLQ